MAPFSTGVVWQSLSEMGECCNGCDDSLTFVVTNAVRPFVAGCCVVEILSFLIWDNWYPWSVELHCEPVDEDV